MATKRTGTTGTTKKSGTSRSKSKAKNNVIYIEEWLAEHPDWNKEKKEQPVKAASASERYSMGDYVRAMGNWDMAHFFADLFYGGNNAEELLAWLNQPCSM